MQSSQLVSIIVPTYNRAKQIITTLNSLFAQDYYPIEIIVVDDASEDNTFSSIESFLSFKNFKYIQNAFNQGESSSVNIGWEVASGKYIAIVNSDDPQNPNWLSQMMTSISEHPGFVIYYPNIKIYDSDRNFLRSVRTKAWSKWRVIGALQVVSSAGAIIDKSKLPKDFKPRINGVKYPSDLFQSLKLSLIGKGFHVDNCFGNWTSQEFNSVALYEPRKLMEEYKSAAQKWLTDNYEFTKKYQTRAYVNLYSQIWRFYQSRLGIWRTIPIFSWKQFLVRLLNPQFVLWFILDIFNWSTSRLIRYVKNRMT